MYANSVFKDSTIYKSWFVGYLSHVIPSTADKSDFQDNHKAYKYAILLIQSSLMM